AVGAASQGRGPSRNASSSKRESKSRAGNPAPQAFARDRKSGDREWSMAKSARAVIVSWCAAAMVLATVAPDAASAARFSFGGGFAHGVRPGGGFGFRPG